jgi:hypothetical protein
MADKKTRETFSGTDIPVGSSLSPVVVEPSPVVADAGEAATVSADAASTDAASTEPTAEDIKREREIVSFLNEFAPTEHRRTVLRNAIKTGEAVEGSAYFQARLKKLQNKVAEA